jgi:hypothetical protein
MRTICGAGPRPAAPSQAAFFFFFFFFLLLLLLIITCAAQAAVPARIVGYFPSWGAERGYSVKNMETSGSADKLTHLLYAFGDVKRNQCAIVNAAADYESPYDATQSV